MCLKREHSIKIQEIVKKKPYLYETLKKIVYLLGSQILVYTDDHK